MVFAPVIRGEAHFGGYRALPVPLRLTFSDGSDVPATASITKWTMSSADTHASRSGGNSSGLLRDFYPKGSDFIRITPARLAQVEKMLNNRPRKCLI